MAARTGADGYDDALGRIKPAKGERAALLRYLEADEVVRLREPATEVREADGRVLLDGEVVVLVTDRKIVVALTSGGFRPRWEAFTLPYGQLEPGVAVDGHRGTDVFVPTSGRRSYRIELSEAAATARLGNALREALRSYRRERMGLDDP